MRFRRHQEAARQSTRRLLALFVLVVIGLVVAVNAVLALTFWLTLPYASRLPLGFFETNTALVLLFVFGGSIVESLRLSKGGPHVAELAGARPVHTGGHDEASRRERRFVHVVQELSLASGQRPAPQAWVLPRDDAINALAAGWNTDDAVVVVTRGALERLTRAELQGVVAHEFSHLVHGDTRLNMRLVGLVWGLQMVWGLGVSLWSTDEQGRRGPGALFGLGLMAVGSLGWLAGRLLQAAVSRQREFLADASAVKYTRDVEGLGGALRKIADQQARHVRGLASAHAASLAHLLLTNVFASRGGWRALLATHPPLGERLSRLYGRELDPDEVLLTADPVAIDAEGDQAPQPPAFAPPAAAATHRHASTAAVPRDAAPAAAGRDATPEAHLHDATQVPAFHDSAEREREALQRIARWHGPGEWQAAMLALEIASGPAAGSAPHWRAYDRACADLSVAAAVRADVAALSSVSRRRVFAELLQRAVGAPPATRRRLWSDRSRRRRMLPHDGPEHAAAAAWRALVIRHGLGATHAAATRGTLARQPATVAAATRAMSRCLALTAEQRLAWCDAALAAMEASGLPAPRSPGIGLAPAIAGREVFAALRVRQLSPMQRPLVIRAWVDAARSIGALPQAADALHLACVALEVPAPDALLSSAPSGAR